MYVVRFTQDKVKQQEKYLRNANFLSAEKKNTNQVYRNPLPLVGTQVGTAGLTVVGATGVPKSVTKQTVILTYQTQQYSVQVAF